MKRLLFFLFCSSLYSQSWIGQSTGFTTASRGIRQIEIVNSNVVWALAYDGMDTTNNIQEFTRTTNGGTTWTPGIINVGNSTYNINSISAVSTTKAWVSALDTAVGMGVIYATADGGTTWNQQNASAFQNANSFINGVIFFNENEGVAFGDPINGEFEIYTTSNGGISWNLVSGTNIPNPLTGEYGYNNGNIKTGNILFLPTNKGRVLKSSDKGITWSVLTSPITDFGGTVTNGRLSFSNENNGLLLKSGTSNNFYTTTNGGVSWSAVSTSASSYRLLSYIPNTSTIVATSSATGDSGSSYSINNGVSYMDIDSGDQRGVSAFINPSTGWCAGFNSSSTIGGIFKYSGPALSNIDFNSNSLFVSIYPNPARDILNFTTTDNTSINNVSILDISGKVVLNSNNFNSNSVDISKLQSGVYFVKFSSDEKSIVKKFIKE
jgi:photosystem II stability/assembly factor-like uncharacterized protein